MQELQALLDDPLPGQHDPRRARRGPKVPLWILGSSLFGAQLAAALGLPYAFASHFAPAALVPALQVYRETFRPSEQLEQPHVMLAANVIVADTDDEARRLFTSHAALVHRRRVPAPARLLPPPIDVDRGLLAAARAAAAGEHAQLLVHRLARDGARAGSTAFVAEHQPDELIVTTSAFDQGARLQSLELLAASTCAGSGAAV